MHYWTNHGIDVDFLPFMHCFLNSRLQSLKATSTCSSRPLSNKSCLGSYKSLLPFIKIPDVVSVVSTLWYCRNFPLLTLLLLDASAWWNPPTMLKQIDRSLKGYACLVGKYSGVLALYLFSLWWRGSVWRLMSKSALLRQFKGEYSPTQGQTPWSSDNELMAIHSLYLGNRFLHYQQWNRIWKRCFARSHHCVSLLL